MWNSSTSLISLCVIYCVQLCCATCVGVACLMASSIAPTMELAVLMLLALFSWSHGSKQPDFKQWSSVYLPDATQNELDAIYPTWKKNAELVSAHNKQNSQFTMTLNKFAHLVSICDQTTSLCKALPFILSFLFIFSDS